MRLPGIDLLSLGVFVEIVDSGNLSQAARSLNMSRATVSYRLAQLEKSLGAELLRRTPQGNELTDVGERVYQHACAILDESAKLCEAASQDSGSLAGRVTLSLPTGYGHRLVGEWLIEFKKQHPAVVLEVRFENFIDNLIRDGVDIAVSVLSTPPPMLVGRDLGLLRYVVCASREWAEKHTMPYTLDELAQVPVITSGGITGTPLVVATRGDQENEILLHPTLWSRSFPYLRDCIVGGVGVGIVPDYIVEEDVRAGTVVTSMDDYLLTVDRAHMYLLYSPSRYQSRAVRGLIDFLFEKRGLPRPIRGSDQQPRREPYP